MKGNSDQGKGMRIVFGIIMVLVYLGVGLLFIFQQFAALINPVVSYVVGGLLIAYGIFRGYRLYLGSN
ncbi:MAG: hypothetical protein K2M13_03600 [Muribaculaceae bacterium]|nr:hypothetical protein [Muribaculaceae bacterium]